MVCMKKIAVLSDIHGNYIAFQKCLEYVLGMGIRAFIFLGDYLGEFPYPQKTMEILYSLKEKYTCFFLRGNKEDYWISRKYDENCVWKNGNSTVGAILACHGSPDKNNEKMFPDGENTKGIMERCAGQYILCGHTHVQGSFSHEGKILLNPGSVGASLYSGGKARFMILYQNGEEWGHQFISLDYDKKKVIKEMEESGLWDAAPYWCRVTKYGMLAGEISHGTVLSRAMELCREETGKCDWYNIPEIYWEEAVQELLGC